MFTKEILIYWEKHTPRSHYFQLSNDRGVLLSKKIMTKENFFRGVLLYCATGLGSPGNGWVSLTETDWYLLQCAFRSKIPATSCNTTLSYVSETDGSVILYVSFFMYLTDPGNFTWICKLIEFYEISYDKAQCWCFQCWNRFFLKKEKMGGYVIMAFWTPFE